MKLAKKKVFVETSQESFNALPYLDSPPCQIGPWGLRHKTPVDVTSFLFSNGSFRARKGHAPAPRNQTVKALSSRTVVSLADEVRTSENVPVVVEGAMKDVQGVR